MVRYHYQLNGHESEQILGDSGGQRILVWCSLWGCKESDKTSDWTTKDNTRNVLVTQQLFVDNMINRQLKPLWFFLVMFPVLFSSHEAEMNHFSIDCLVSRVQTIFYLVCSNRKGGKYIWDLHPQLPSLKSSSSNGKVFKSSQPKVFSILHWSQRGL